MFLQKRQTIRLCTARNECPLFYFIICIENQSFDLIMTWSSVDPNYLIPVRTFMKVQLQHQKWTEVKNSKYSAHRREKRLANDIDLLHAPK